MRLRIIVLRAVVAVSAVLLFANISISADGALRSGTIEDVTAEGLYTYLKVSENDGKFFYVVAETCSAAKNEKVKVVKADHYKAMVIPPLGGKVEDVYLAHRLIIEGRDVIAAAGEGKIPQGCQILE